MSENKNPGGEKKLSVSSKTLTLKPRTETGVVRQSFSHGRSKQVVVEKVKRRTVGAPGETKVEAVPAAEAKKAVIEQLVKGNVDTVKKMNGIGFTCFCCVGC